MEKEAYIEVSIESNADAGEVLAELDDTSVLGAWEEDGVIRLYWRASSWRPDALERLRAALARLGRVAEGAGIICDQLDEQDWNSSWARSIRPVRIGKRVLIRQSWNFEERRAGDIELVLDPGQAFGTGFHATTRLLIEWLEDRVRGGETVLDAGTGSGILAMIALRLGAASALGVDHDPVAIACAREYALLNGFGSELELRHASIEELPGSKFDFVLANLDRNTLLLHGGKLMELLAGDGFLLITGICAEDDREITDLFSASGAGVARRKVDEDWLAIELCRRR